MSISSRPISDAPIADGGQEYAASTTWETERSKSGKKPWHWIEIEVDRCTLEYGSAFGSPTISPSCSAILGTTGEDKCFNSWETCQVPDDFVSDTFWIRFAIPVADMPRGQFFFGDDDGLDVFLPLLKSVRYSPTLPEPGESMGMRARLDVELFDAPHHDRGIDKYIADRAYDPIRNGTFLRKLKARFPFYIGRRLRWYQGYITDNTKLADFRRRDYIMERFEGPDANGRVTIVAKDVLKLLDNDRAQAPLKSTGELAAAMADTDTPTTIDVTTTDTTEYDIIGSPGAAQYVRVGGEVITYTGTTVIDSDTVRLTGVTRSAPSPYTTPLEDHDEGDAVQLCLLLQGTIPAVVRELMVDYGGIDASYIPYADWVSEATTWLASDSIQRLICEPEGVQDLINEIISQTLSWGFWFDDVGQEIKFRAIRPPDTNDTIQTVTDDANLIQGTIRIADDPDKIINEVQVVYGQIDPTKRKDELENYRKGISVVDADSQSANEINQRRIKRIFARWNPPTNSAVMLRYAERTLQSRAQNIFNVEFELERKDEGITTAQFADLTTIYIIDAFGVPVTTRVQILRADTVGENMRYKARQDFFRSALFARFAPAALAGLTWDTATQDQKDTYLFWADSNGKLGSLGSPTILEDGKTWA